MNPFHFDPSPGKGTNKSRQQRYQGEEELRTMVLNGTDFINVTWPALPDPLGLIAGYKIYNSTDNTTWNLAGGSTNAPLTDLYFNNTGISPGIYYYSVKVVFKGYDNDDGDHVTHEIG